MEMHNIPYQIHPLARVIAYKLYVLHVNDDERDRLSIDDIKALFSVSVSKNLIRSALGVLRDDSYVTRMGNSTDGYTFRVTHEGLLMVQRGLRKRESDIAHFHKYQDEALDELAGPNSNWLSDDERLDIDAWQPLQIDRDDPLYVDAIQNVTEALERIRGDNGFAEKHPEQRNGIVATIEDGIEWITQKMPSKNQI